MEKGIIPLQNKMPDTLDAMKQKIDVAFDFERFLTLGYLGNGSDFDIQEMIPFLLAAIDENQCEDIENKKAFFALWADRFFHCLFPLKPYKVIWVEHSNELLQILNRARAVLEELEPDFSVAAFERDTGEMMVKYKNQENDSLIEGSFLNLLQHLNLYYATLAYEAGNADEFRERLRTVLEDTKRNATDLFSSMDVPGWLGSDLMFWDEEGFNAERIPGFRYWQNPLSWLYNESAANGNGDIELARKLMPAYEEYVAFLEDLRPAKPQPCLIELVSKEKERLKSLVLCSTVS